MTPTSQHRLEPIPNKVRRIHGKNSGTQGTFDAWVILCHMGMGHGINSGLVL